MHKDLLLDQISVSISDIGIKVESVDENTGFKPNKDYEAFLGSQIADISLYLYNKELLTQDNRQIVFNAQDSWQLSKSKDQYIFDFFSPDYGKNPYKSLVVDTDFSKGDIYSRHFDEGNGQLYNPLDYPLDELLMMHMLSKKRGIIVHASGMEINGEGVLFMGKSGAGKSTITNIFLTDGNNKVLNDDRIIIRNINNQFLIYGTPWHGDIKECSGQKTPLKKIYFIKHGKENRVRELTSIEKVSRLIVFGFTTLWDKEGMRFSLDFCSKISEAVPMYELEFLPDESVISFIKDKK